MFLRTPWLRVEASARLSGRVLNANEVINRQICTPTAARVCGRIQVDNMHYKIYKQLRPCLEERARLTGFWMRQERLKRQLDADMSAARAELAALPSNIPLPHEFLSHLNNLIACLLYTSPSPRD